MGSILDNYKRQLEEDRMNESNDFEMPSFGDDIADGFSKDVDKEAVAKRVKNLGMTQMTWRMYSISLIRNFHVSQKPNWTLMDVLLWMMI